MRQLVHVRACTRLQTNTLEHFIYCIKYLQVFPTHLSIKGTHAVKVDVPEMTTSHIRVYGNASEQVIMQIELIGTVANGWQFSFNLWSCRIMLSKLLCIQFCCLVASLCVYTCIMYSVHCVHVHVGTCIRFCCSFQEAGQISGKIFFAFQKSPYPLSSFVVWRQQTTVSRMCCHSALVKQQTRAGWRCF